MYNAFKKAFPEGTYSNGEGDEFELSYRSPNKLAVEMVVDGQESAKMYQQYSGEWRVEDYSTGSIKVFKTPKQAAESLRTSFGDFKHVKKSKK